VDLLVHGADDRPRAPRGRGRWRALLRPGSRQVPAPVVALLAVGAAGTALAGVLAAGPVTEAERTRVEPAAVLQVTGLSTGYRPPGPVSGTLVLRVGNRRDRVVEVRAVQLRVPGVEVPAVAPRLPLTVPPRGGQTLRLVLRVPDCDALRAGGTLRVALAAGRGPEQVLERPLPSGSATGRARAADVADERLQRGCHRQRAGRSLAPTSGA
jgi:hypothetical protein